jgi:1-acyl-sn-glycerol-3-phosphate acyltransferase
MTRAEGELMTTFVKMRYLTLPLRVLWKIWLSLNFALGMIVLYPFFYVLLSREKYYPAAFRLMRGWAHWLAYTSGIFESVHGYKNARMHQPAIFCANHNSYIDIMLAYVFIPCYFVFMGKREIESIPLFNIFFRGMNILVDRKSNVDAHKAFVRAGEEIDKGNSIFIFPEGGIFFKGPELKRFKNGAFRLAIEKQVPIVPVTYRNNWRILQTGSFLMARAGPGIARIIVHTPIHTTGMTQENLIDLQDKTFHAIKGGFEGIRS